MKNHQNLRSLFFISLVWLITSCATTHPNEKLIVGTWRTVKVEKYVDESAMKAAAATPSSKTGSNVNRTETTSPNDPQRGIQSTDAERENKVQNKLNRLIQSEERAVLVIDSGHFASKQYPGTLKRATWKMKPNGMVIIAKNLENKERVRMEIEEISENQAVIIQELPVGSLRITYARER